MNNREALWRELHTARLVEGELPHAKGDSPWYVRAMLGVAGWIGALFLLGFIGVGLRFVVDDPDAALVVGALCCAGAIAIFRIAGENNFLTQFGLAVSLAGQIMVGYGLTTFFKNADQPAYFLLLALFEAALAALVPNFIHRVWSAFAAVVSLNFAFALLGIAHLLPGVLAAALATIWLNEFRWAGRGSLIRGIGYGVALGLMQVETHLLLGGRDLWVGRDVKSAWLISPWVGPLLAGMALVWVVFKLLDRYAVTPTSRVGAASLAAATLIAAASIMAPGVSASLVVLLLGFANANRSLFGLGVVALLAYLSHFYYQLDITLLAKSAVLAGTGCVLIGARYAMHVLFPTKEQGDA